MALKEHLRIELNAEGSAALEAIMKATGLKRTQVVHMVLAEAVRRIPSGVGLVGKRKPTQAEIERGLELEPLAHAVLNGAPQTDTQRDPDEVLREAQRKLEARRGEPAADVASQWIDEEQVKSVMTTTKDVRPLERGKVAPIPKPGKSK